MSWWRHAPRERAPARLRAARAASIAEGPQLVADEVERRHEDDGDRLREDLPPVENVDEDDQPELIDRERRERDDEEAGALQGEATLLIDKGPVAIPPVVIGGGDDEGDGRRDMR